MVAENTKKISGIVKKYILPIFLVVACFWDVNKGLDLSDTGYNLERYYNFFSYDASNRLSKFWSDYIGHLFTRIPGGDTWLGMSIYCTAVVAAIVIIAYYFCSMFLSSYVVFICELVAIWLYWIPAVVLYDSLSFLLLEIAIVLLYYALKKDSIKKFLCAGVVLGINTFVRMPNITYIILILWVWLYAWLYRSKLEGAIGVPWVISRTSVCVLGYLIGIAGSFLYTLRFSQLDSYFKVINQLVGNSKVVGYTLGEMAFGTISYILEQIPYMIVICDIYILAVALIYMAEKNKKKEEGLAVQKKAVCLLTVVSIVLVIVVAYYKYEWFSTDYNQYSSIKSIVALVYLWGIVVSIINVFWKSTKSECMAALVYISLLWVIPLGSNNQIYLDIANSFLLFPIICYLTKELLAKIQETEQKKNIFGAGILAKLILGIVCTLILFQTSLFGITFSFHDSDIDTTIEAHNVAFGMKTSKEKAVAVTSLLTFLKDEKIGCSSMIQYCDSPGLYYLLQMQRGIQHSWPELPTCTLERLNKYLEEAGGLDELPIIIITEEMSRFFQKVYRCEEVYIEEEKEVEFFYDEKIRALMNFMSRNQYRLIYDDKNMYAVYSIVKN